MSSVVADTHAAILTRIEREIDAATPRIVVHPLDNEIAKTLARVPRHTVADMPDRIIVATPLRLNLPPVSRDGRIRQLTSLKVIW